jgi:hypothetical protein
MGAIFIWLISLFLSVCWLEKFLFSLGAFLCYSVLVMFATYDHNEYCDCCRTTCCACVSFYSLTFETVFLL